MRNHRAVFVRVLAVLAVVLVQHSAAKNFTRCGLTQELAKQGFPRSFIGNWVCLIEHESFKDTSKIINKANGSKGLGLFQINSKEWCTYSKPGGVCRIKCEDLINDDIKDDSTCAKKVYEKVGFQGWDGWKRGCYKKKLPIPPC